MNSDTKYLVVLAKQVKQPKIKLPFIEGHTPKIQDNDQSIALGAINETNPTRLRSQTQPNGKIREWRADWQD
jgi:hypothetical protein